ncbi:BTB/POZ domain protein [Rhizoctonia solani AG-3 Rhs1AP]|uniref:BTB/POZ domain protein n=2 Tax=Rhizoctonia solani AG-3 TaxID=1086053 RepID=A0A074RN13_9AGAM|nr:BTB/POZ domain protein [Rhizoctonia solani AG-3 Rhs1AP]KEP48481.1 BTB/POZ domain protein [Rhizoctonia solani 123E]
MGSNNLISTSQAGHWVLNYIDEASDLKPDGKLLHPLSPFGRCMTEHRSECEGAHAYLNPTNTPMEIEDTLFNVHKYQLVKSEVFSDMFKMPKAEGSGPEEGASPEHPIVLKGVAASDFAALLTVLYASQFSADQPTPKAALIVPAFRLANMLNFSDLRAYLLPLAEERLGDVDKIIFAREFDIKEWLAPAHVRLCQREELLSSEEARNLGAESVLIISRMREQHRVPPSSSPMIVNQGYCFGCAGLTFVSSGFTCDGCHGRPPDPGFLLYNGPGRMGQIVPSTDDNAIEAGVKKWVGDGCTVKE